MLEHCEAVGNGYSGVEISTGADPVLRDCRLRGNAGSGAFVYEAGRADGWKGA